MKNKMRILTALLSVVLLLAGYVLTRYMLFDLHGMKQWPLILLIISTVVVVAAWVQKSRLIPLITSAAYTASFFSGVLFHTNSVDPGGTATNNLWIIWTGMYLLIILVSIIIELVSRFRNRANNDSRHK